MLIKVAQLYTKDCRGSALVELALIALPLFVVILATLQNALVSVARISLDANVQSMTYDTTNLDKPLIANILTRDNLCARQGFYLTDCATSPDFCLSIVSLDIVKFENISKLDCGGGSQIDTTKTGPLALIVEYPVPEFLNALSLLQMGTSNSSTRMKIRSVALYIPG